MAGSAEIACWSIPLTVLEGGLMGETIHGGLAEFCRVPAHQLICVPEGVSFADAAALPVAYGTARRLMHTNGQVRAGERVLILGGERRRRCLLSATRKARRRGSRRMRRKREASGSLAPARGPTRPSTTPRFRRRNLCDVRQADTLWRAGPVCRYGGQLHR